MTNLSPKKPSFAARFRQRYSLRLHMSLILLATVSAGMLATRVMLALQVKNVLVRYPLAVVFAYLTFFIWVKLWLKYVAPAPAVRAGQRTSGSGFNLFSGSSSGGSTSTGTGFRGGGGNFGGGGASGSFDVVPLPLTDSGAEIASVAQDAGSSVAAAAGDVAKNAAGGVIGDAVSSSLDDEKGCLIAIVLLAIAAVIFGAGLYLVYEAPFILSEAAFQAILAGGLVRGARRLESGDWLGSVFRATWLPFVLTLLLSLLAGYLLHHFFPGVTRISELFAHIRGK